MRRKHTRGLCYRLLGGLLCLCMAASEVSGMASVRAFAAEPAGEVAQAPLGADSADVSPSSEDAQPAQNTGEAPQEPAGPPADTAEAPPAAPDRQEPAAPAENMDDPAGPAQAPAEPADFSAQPASDPAPTEDEAQPTADPAPIAAPTAAPLPAPTALTDAPTEVYVPAAPADVEGAVQADTVEEALALLKEGGTIWLTASVAMDEARLAAQAVTVCSFGEAGPYTLTKAGGGKNMFALSDGAALTLQNVVVDAAANAAGRTICAADSTLTLGAGAVLKGNTSHGAVYLEGATLHMDGGTICGNTAADPVSTKEWEPAPPNWTAASVRYAYDAALGEGQGLGGAVLMVNDSVFTLSSGEVSGNSAVCGGAIYAWGGCRLTLDEGTLAGNTATGAVYAATGGAIAVDGGSCALTISGAAITGNTAMHDDSRSGHGGAFWFGIDVGRLDFVMTSGRIAENNAKDGSVFYSFAADGLIDISGGGSLIEKNEASGNGAFYVGMYPGNELSARAHFTVRDGATFAENHANKGSCLYFTRDRGTNGLTLNGAVFKDNQSDNDAGVMQYGVPNSTFEVIGSTFTNNRTGNRGGCFYVTADAQDSTFTFEDTTFTDNYAKQQGGVWRGFPPHITITYTNCTFDGNTAELGDGGCFYCPGDGPESSVTIDGGSFTNNFSGSSGGAFRVNLDGGTVTVKGGALFEGNKADVNAGAFSIRRRGGDYYGEAYLLECDILNNVCNADFSRYTADDKAPTQHYNTGGVYIGENITCHMYDALITDNYVEDGYAENVVGSGIALCPNAKVFLFADHGAMIYGNGEEDTMDILAVPYDDVIHHETPAMLYVSGVTPDGRNYNWQNLEDADARTGLYDWTEIRREKESGIMMAAAMDDDYSGEKTLDPVGFKANVDAGIATMALDGDDEYKVRIIGNRSADALYGAGGVMVNGTVIAGNFDVGVEKQVEVKGATTEKETALKTQQEYTFRFAIIDVGSKETAALGNSTRGQLVESAEIPYQTTHHGEGTLTFTRDEITISAEEATDYGVSEEGTYVWLYCTFTLKGADTIALGEKTESGKEQLKKSDFGLAEKRDYVFLLQETANGGAAETEIECAVYDSVGNKLEGSFSTGAGYTGNHIAKFQFTCKNTFEFGELDLSKTVEGPGDKGKWWSFTITLENDGAPVEGTFPLEVWEGGAKKTGDFENGDLAFLEGKAEVTFTAGKATVQLKHGQTLKIGDLPVGAEYTVTETSNGDFTSTPSGEKGTIPGPKADGSADPAEVHFTNTRKTGELSIRKTVSGTAGETDRLFRFDIALLDGAAPVGGSFAYTQTGGVSHQAGDSLSESGGTITFSAEGKATVYLKHGQTITISGLPAGASYTVVETEADTGGYRTTKTGDAGTIAADTTAAAVFVNTMPKVATGALRVEKRVTGEGDTSRDFCFAVAFAPADADLSDATAVKYDADGAALAEALAVDGDGVLRFTLRHGQHVDITGLPAGTSFTVTEEDYTADGYTTTVTDTDGEPDGKGTIRAGEMDGVRFVNDKPTAPPPPPPTTPPPPEDIPNTGADSHIGLWAGLLALALGGLLLSLLLLKNSRMIAPKGAHAKK